MGVKRSLSVSEVLGMTWALRLARPLVCHSEEGSQEESGAE